MRRLTVTLAAAAFVLGSMALTASAQPQGAANFHTQAQNVTPIQKVGCRGPGRWCRWGFHHVCGPVRCWCAPC